MQSPDIAEKLKVLCYLPQFFQLVVANSSIRMLSAFLPPRPAALFAFSLIAVHADAQVSSQIVQLSAGWNSVHLQVVPDGTVGETFGGTPVDLVTTFYPEKQQVAALQDPAAEVWKNPEWRTWQPVGRPGDFLNNLHALEGGRAYLIRSTAAATLTVSGTLATGRLRWQAQSFNFTGLPADPESPATFAGFFANSPAHQPLRAYRLLTGKWHPVAPTAAITPGAAYWIWCGEGSEYQGPLDVRVTENPQLNTAEDSVTIGLLSTTGIALPVRITARGTLPLTAVTRERLTAATPAGLSSEPHTFSANPVDPGWYRIAWAAGAAPSAGAASLLEFRAAGVCLTVPVRSTPVVPAR